jgi:hypothetical protein
VEKDEILVPVRVWHRHPPKVRPKEAKQSPTQARARTPHGNSPPSMQRKPGPFQSRPIGWSWSRWPSGRALEPRTRNPEPQQPGTHSPAVTFTPSGLRLVSVEGVGR